MEASTHPDSPASADSSAQTAAALGPFRPRNHIFEDEFRSFPPRPILASVRQGPFARGRRRVAIAFGASALLCFLLAPAAAASELAYYVLVLGKLHWVGAALLVGGLVLLTVGSFVQRRFDYVRHGVPVAARVLRAEVVRILMGKNAPDETRLAVDVEYDDPDRGEHVYASFTSDNMPFAGAIRRYSTPLKPGDWLTVVGLPGRFEATRQLYAFLRLNPDLQYIYKNGKPMRSDPVGGVLIAIALVVGGVLGGGALLGYGGRWELIGEDDVRFFFGPGVGAALGLAVAIPLLLRSLRRTQDQSSRRQSYFIALVGGPLFGAMAGMFGMLCVNCEFDSSPSAYRDVQVLKFWQETWTPLFIRNYKIEFQQAFGGTHHRYPARVDRMALFGGTRVGVAEVGEGALGMPWVRGLHPVILVPLEDGGDESTAVATFETRTGDTREVVRLKPVIMLPGGELRAPSEWAVRKVRENLEAGRGS